MVHIYTSMFVLLTLTKNNGKSTFNVQNEHVMFTGKKLV